MNRPEDHLRTTNTHLTPTDSAVSIADDYEFEDDEYYYDNDDIGDEYYYEDTEEDQLSPPTIMQIVSSVQSKLREEPSSAGSNRRPRTRLPFNQGGAFRRRPPPALSSKSVNPFLSSRPSHSSLQTSSPSPAVFRNRQIARRPKQQVETFEIPNSLTRFAGRQVAVKGFPNGLPDATPEGVVIALLNAQNSKYTAVWHWW